MKQLVARSMEEGASVSSTLRERRSRASEEVIEMAKVVRRTGGNLHVARTGGEGFSRRRRLTLRFASPRKHGCPCTSFI